MMALRFACEHPDRVAAVGVVAAAYLVRGWCVPRRPVPVMYIHGMRDRVLPYRGLRWSPLLGTSIPSVPQTNAFFGRLDAAHGVRPWP